jgi:hypothetical protein
MVHVNEKADSSIRELLGIRYSLVPTDLVIELANLSVSYYNDVHGPLQRIWGRPDRIRVFGVMTLVPYCES